MQALKPPSIPDLLFTTLPTSPTIKTAYTFTTLHENKSPSPSTSPPLWLLFINGLGLPQAFWQPALHELKSLIPSDFPTTIYTTTYDRQYQGLSRPIDNPPSTTSPPPPGPLHSFESTIDELTSLVTYLKSQHPPFATATTILIAHSIGVPLARLYIASQSQSTHPIFALLMLDSNLAATNFTSLLPDPSSSTYSPTTLPPDTTPDQLLWSRANYTAMFAPTAPNAEGLDRSKLPDLLPHANVPILPLAPPAIIRVLAHDPETFEEEGTRICTKGLTRMCIQPAWDEYNRGLLELDGKGNEEVKTVKGAGHFLQKDQPGAVAGEIWGVIGEVTGSF